MKVKNLYFEWWDKIAEVDGLQDCMETSEDVCQVQRHVNYAIKPKTISEKDWCNIIVTDMWHENLSKHV